jgi:ubiquinone/menaquinone biosynthesis C-methylase UbiE
MKHHQVQAEFSRQAEPMTAAQAFRDSRPIQEIVQALGRPPLGRVLDLACGPGIVSEALAPLAAELVVSDLTPKMVELTRQRLAQAGFTAVPGAIATAERLPLPADAFDVVVTRLSIHHFARPAVVLGEIWRVLRPGGRLVVVDIVSTDQTETSVLHNALERLRDPTHVRMWSRDELLDMLAAAGFCVQHQVSWGQERRFGEWARIVDDAARMEPLREVMAALAHAGIDPGIGLHESEGEVGFVHTWFLALAHREQDVPRERPF